MSSDGTNYLKLIIPTDLHIKDRTVTFFKFLMGLTDFKYGAPNYGKYPVYPDNMKAQAF